MLFPAPDVAAVELGDQKAIVAAASAPISAEDVALAEAFAADGVKREAHDLARLGRIDWGPLVKLWCEAAAIAPAPVNLLQCARARFGATGQMSNPQPSLEAVRREEAERSLVLVRAALEVVGGSAEADAETASALAIAASCLQALAEDKKPAEECPPPYRE